MKKIALFINLLCFLSMSVFAQQTSWNPTIAASGVLPACSTNQLTPIAIIFPTSVNNYTTITSSGTPWQFYSCYTGAKSLKMTPRKIRLIASDGSTVITPYDKTNDSSVDPVDVIANQLDILKDVSTSDFVNGSFTIDTIELTFDNVLQANALANFTDELGNKLTCGTSSKVFSSSSVQNTKASPIGLEMGTMNGRPMSFYQKHSVSGLNTYGNTQGASWFAVNAIPAVPSGFTVDANTYFFDGTNKTYGGYATAFSGDLEKSTSPSVKSVAMKLTDVDGNNPGYISSLGGYSTKYIVASMKLRNPLKIKSNSKFNIDISLDISKMFAWGFYYSTAVSSGVTPTITSDNSYSRVSSGASSITNDCQNMVIGPMLLKIKKIAVKD